MWDPFVTRELTVRDLLVHRSGLGLGAGDLLWWPASTYDRKEIARRLRFIQPATSFRTRLRVRQRAVSGRGRADRGDQRPVVGGLRLDADPREGRDDAAATCATRRRPAGGNVATTHAPIDGKVRPIAPFDSDNTNPAGGINSSAEDMAKWLRVQLSGGKLADGSRLFSAATARQLTTIVTPIPIGDPPPELAPLKANFRGYALGLDIRDYRGHKVADAHRRAARLRLAGGDDSRPQRRRRRADEPGIGRGVRLDRLPHPRSLSRRAGVRLDRRLSKVHGAHRRAATRERAEGARRRARRRVEPSLAAREVRRHLPRRVVRRHRDRARSAASSSMRFSHTPLLVGDLEHWQHDTFIARWRDRELRADAYVTFALNPDGSIDQAKMRAVSPATDFSFDFQDLLLKPVR